MNKTRKWQVMTVVFFVATVALAANTPRHSKAPRGYVSAAGVGLGPGQQRLRLGIAIIATSEEDLLNRLDRTRDATEKVRLLGALAQVGTSRSLDVVERYIDDRGRGVAEQACETIGTIGGTRATEILLPRLEDRRSSVRQNVVHGLVLADTPAGDDAVIALATAPGILAQAATLALAQGGRANAIAVLRNLLVSGSQDVVESVIYALSESGTLEAAAFVKECLRAERASVRVAAIRCLPGDIDDATFAVVLDMASGVDTAAALAAVNTLGRLRDARAIPTLIDLSVDGAIMLRIGAVDALSEFDAPEVRKALIALLLVAPADVLQSVVYALVREGSDEALDALYAGAESGRHLLREACFRTLVREVDSLRVETMLLAVLDKGPRDLQSEALDALVARRNPAALDVLERWVDGAHRERRDIGFQLLSRLGTPDSMARLKRIAFSHASAQVRVQALQVLDRNSDPEITEHLLELVQTGTDEEARTAAWQLAHSSDPRAAVALADAALHGRTSVASAAMDALPQVGGAAAEAALLTLAKGKGQSSQQALAHLMQQGNPQAFGLAGEVLRKGKPREAAEMVYVLGRAQGPEAEALLEDAVKSEHPEVRSTAAQVLAQRGDAESAGELLRMSRDPSPEVRASALSALVEVGGPAAVDRLLEQATEGTPEERAQGVSFLARVGDERAADFVMRAANDSNPEVAENAIGQLGWTGGDEVDALLGARLTDPSAPASVRRIAACMLQSRGGQAAERYRAEIDALVESSDEGGGCD